MPSIDAIIRHYVDSFGEAASIALLKALADPTAGGAGYKVTFKSIIDADGWEVHQASRLIVLDTTNWSFENDTKALAKNLREAVETEIFKIRTALLPRLGWGTGKVLLGVVETSVGLIGVVVPEPGTTAAGVVVTSLGVNTIADGFSQLAGANRGEGYNILAEASGSVGSELARIAGKDPALGEAIGKGAFLATSIGMGSVGSIRVLKIPGESFLQAGVKGKPGGFTVGRASMAYNHGRAKDGVTILSINNNAKQSILRFVTHNGDLAVNARIGRLFEGSRIVKGQTILKHSTSPNQILKGLIKLAWHGALRGIK